MSNLIRKSKLRITFTTILELEFIMTMTDQVEAVEAEEQDTVFRVPVVKAKGEFLDVHTGKLPEHVYREAMALGLKQLLNRGNTKITKEAYPDPDGLKSAALDKANEQLEAMYAGKIRIVGAKADKVPGVVMTEARRIARNLVKEELKRQGVKISYVEAKEITKAANALIAANPVIIDQAKEELERRSAASLKIDIGGIPISQKKVQAAEAKKDEKVLSAAKAGQIATRARPQPRA